MDNKPTEPLTESAPNEFDRQNLDDLLSLRGKPFANWKEERLYLRKKWGMQGRKVEPEANALGAEKDLSGEDVL